jgi:serine/threonine protein kinase/Tfp pilus assembly protein PilF
MSEDRRPPDDPTNTDGILGAENADENSKGQDDKLPDRRIGDFDLLRELGRGGMGVVYEARQVSLNRRVALKVLPPGLGMTEIAVQRFEREARAAAKLHHTNIVPVHAIGEEEGCHYYAMELVDGEPLSRVLNDLRGQGSNPLLESIVNQTAADAPSREKEVAGSPTTSGPTSLSDTASSSREWFDTVARLLAEVADALHYAHGRGVIHRDVKPANLMLSTDGRLCLTDFGLARVAQEPGMTVSGSFLGTPAYMSPEQIAAGRVQVDNRSDIYSLGAVLYEMLCLRRPFTGESRDEILNGIMTKDPRPPRRFNPRIPVDLETICQKAMEKDRDRRYQSAGEFANDLRQYLQRGLITARRAGLPRRMWKSVRRYPVASVAVVAGILLVLVGGYAWRASRHGAEQEVQRLLSDTRYSLNQGDHRQALKQADEALTRDPNSTEARFIRARCLIELARAQEAIDEAQRLITEDPDNWIGHAILVQAGQFSDTFTGEIEPHIAAVESLAPDTAEALTLRSYLSDSNTEAVELLDRAVTIAPGYSEALYERAFRHIGLKNFEAALADADRLMVAQPRSSLGYRMRATVFANLHDEAGALEEIDRAIELNPDDPLNYSVRWGLLGSLFADEQKVLADISKMIELEPTLPWGYFFRALVHRGVGRFQDALSDLERVRELNPDSRSAIDSLIDVYTDLGQHEEVRILLTELGQRRSEWRDPETIAWSHRVSSDALLRLGDLPGALAEADFAIESEPDGYANYLQRAEVRQLQEGAVALGEDCELAAAVELHDFDPLLSRANQLFGRCQRPDLALADYTRLIELAPHWPDPYYHRAMLRTFEGLFDEALADIDNAIELAPRWIWAHYHRGRILQRMGFLAEAVEAYERTVVAGGQEHPQIAIDRATLLAQLGRSEAAAEVLDEQIDRFPNVVELYRRRAFVSFWLGRVDEAVDFLDRALEIDPADAKLYLHRAGMACYTDTDCDSAVADVDRALSMEPENPDVWGIVSWVHAFDIFEPCPAHYNGNLALNMAQRVDSFMPIHYSVKFILGAVLYRHGEYRKARDAIERSLELGLERENWWSAPCAHFFLALSEWQLGNQTQARAHYQRGLALTERTVPDSPLLLRCRDEAARTLGVEWRKASLVSDYSSSPSQSRHTPTVAALRPQR